MKHSIQIKTAVSILSVSASALLGLTPNAQAAVIAASLDAATGSNWRTASTTEADLQYGTDGYVLFGVDEPTGSYFGSGYNASITNLNNDYFLPSYLTLAVAGDFALWSGNGNWGLIQEPDNGNVLTPTPALLWDGAGGAHSMTFTRVTNQAFRLTILVGVSSDGGWNSSYNLSLNAGATGSAGAITVGGPTPPGMMYQSFDIDAGTDPIVLSVTGGSRPNIAGFAFDAVHLPPVQISKANNGDALNLGSSWVGGVAPDEAKVAQWDATAVSAASRNAAIGASATWDGIKVLSPGGPVVIGATPGATLTLDGGAATDIDMSTATQDLTVNAAVALGNAAHIWDVGAGRNLTLASLSGAGASTLIAKQGSGMATIQGGTFTLQGLRIGTNGGDEGKLVVAGGSITAGNQAALVGHGAGSVGELEFSGGTHSFGGDGYGNTIWVGRNGGNGTLRISGGTVAVGGAGFPDASLNVGVANGEPAAPTGSLVVSGGTLEIGRRILVGNNSGAATGSLTLSGSGVIDMKRTGSNVEGDLGMLRPGAGTVAINLDGGTFILSGIRLTESSAAQANINYNGTTLRANINSSANTGGNFYNAPGGANHLLTNAGLVLDSNGFTMLMNANYVDALGANGRVTKNGAGLAVLSGLNSYTGITTINQGSLAMSGTYSGGIVVNSGGTLVPGFNGTDPLTTSTLTLGAGGAVEFEFGAGNDTITITAPITGLTIGATALSLYETGTTTAFATNGTYPLFDYDTAFAGSLASFAIANPLAGKSYTVTDNAGATAIELTIGDAAVSEWNVAIGGNWPTAGSWLGGVPNGVGAVAKFGAAIGGPANVQIVGAKTVGGIIFDNAESYTIAGTDALTINNGAASGSIVVNNGSHTIATPVALAVNTTVNSLAGTTLTFAGAMSGAKIFTVNGAGTVILTATNTHAKTVIGGGTLQLGNGGTTGSVLGDISNAGTLAFNRSDDLTFSNVISGTGNVRKVGENTLTFSAPNTYSGGTIVSGGVLAIGSNANLGDAAGGLTLDKDSFSTTAALSVSTTLSLGARSIEIGGGGGEFQVPTGVTLTANGTLNGAGLFTKSGAGTLVLSNAGNSLSGDFVIAGGTVLATAGGGGGTSTLGQAGLARTITVNGGATLQFNAHDTFGNHVANPQFTLHIKGGTVLNGPVPGFAGAYTTLGPIALTTGTLTTTGGANATFPAFQLKGDLVSNGASVINTTSTPASFNGIQVTDTRTFSVETGSLTVSAPLVDRFDGGASEIVKTGPGILNLNGVQTYDVLTTNEGTTNLNSALGTGASTLNANATTNISVSQTLAALNIGDGAVVALSNPPPPAPAFAAGDDIFGQTGEDFAVSATQAVPEPGAAALLLSALAMLVGPRRRKA